MKHDHRINSRMFVLLLLFIILITGCAKSVATESDQRPLPTPSIGPTKEPPSFRIVIDAGHGGKDPGAIGVSGAYEKEFNLSLAARLFELLEQDPIFETRLTRGGDEFISLDERATFANDWNADALISIHGNTFEDPAVNGTETLYYSKMSKPLAQTIQNEVSVALDTRDRGIVKKKFAILKNTNMPSVIVEVGYLTNANEEEWILSDEAQDLAARAIYNGLKEHFGEGSA